MGAWSKAFLAVFGLVALALGAWPVLLLAFGYLAWSLRRRRAKPSARDDASTGRGRPLVRWGAGLSLLVLALAALASGGRYSVLLLLSGGLAFLFWPAARVRGLLGRVAAVPDSVLLRSVLFPVQWHAVVEVRFEGDEQVRAMSAVEGKLLLFGGKRPCVFLVTTVRALSPARAARAVESKLRARSRVLADRCAYLFPLDGGAAAGLLARSMERLDVKLEEVRSASSLPFDMLAMQTEGGRITGYAVCRTVEGTAAPSLPSADVKPSRQPLLWEMAEAIEERRGWPAPDERGALLASLNATRSEPVGDRIVMKGETPAGLSVGTAGGACVELTRPQLRALMGIYG